MLQSNSLYSWGQADSYKNPTMGLKNVSKCPSLETRHLKKWLSLLLGDRRFIEEKTYWMHEQNDKFMQQGDKFMRQM